MSKKKLEQRPILRFLLTFHCDFVFSCSRMSEQVHLNGNFAERFF